MTKQTITIDTEHCTGDQLNLLAEVLVLSAANMLSDKRGTPKVQPLEVMGLVSLATTDAWRDINKDLQAKMAERKAEKP